MISLDRSSQLLGYDAGGYSATEVQKRRQDPNIFADTVRGVVNGVEEGFKSILGLADFVTFGTTDLDNWDLIDAPETGVGLFVSGIAQFVPGLVVGGPLLSAASKAGKVGAALSKLPNAAKAAAAAGNKGQAILLSAGANIQQGALAGAVADFVAFSGDEARLSDLITNGTLSDIPVLGGVADTQIVQAIAGVLDNDPDDIDKDTFIGRLQNVGEGALLGSIIDPLFEMTRGLLKANKVRKLVEAGSDEATAVRAVYKGEHRLEIETPEVDIDDLPGDEPIQVARFGDVEETTPNAIKKEVEAHKKELNDDLARYSSDESLEEYLSPFGLTKDKGTRVNPRDLSAEERKILGLRRASQNRSMFTGTEDSGTLFARLLEDEMAAAGGDEKLVMSEFMARQLDKSLDLIGDQKTRDYVKAVAATDPTKLREIRNRTVSLRFAAEAEAANLTEKIQQTLATPGYSTADLQEILVRTKSTLKTLRHIKEVGSETARTLRSFGNEIDVDDLVAKADERGMEWRNLDRLEELVALGVNEETRGKATKILKEISDVMGDDPYNGITALDTFMQSNTVQRVGAVATELWLNAILSTPGTWVVNGMSAATMSVFQPLETMFGALVKSTNPAIRGEMLQIASREMRAVTGLFSEIGEAWRVAAGGTGTIYRGGTTKFDLDNAFSPTGQALGGSPVGRAMASFLTFPSTVLERTDDFFKALNYRSRAGAELRELAMTKGVPPGDVEGWVQGRLKDITTNRQALREKAAVEEVVSDVVRSGVPDVQKASAEAMDVNSRQVRELLDVHDRAITHAQDVTFTRSLSADNGRITGFGVHVQNVVRENPFMRFALPFVRTPANIAQYGFDRSFGTVFTSVPLMADRMAARFGVDTPGLRMLAGKLSRELLSADPRIAAKAQGRVMTSLLFAGGLVTMATSTGGTMPRITGSGPTDKEERDALIAAGWQPYSIRVNGRYYSYSRFDPFATLLGSIADYAEASQRGAMDPETAKILELQPAAMVAALSNNITNKTYLQGLANLIEVLQGDERSAGNVLSGFVASGIPGIVANSIGQTDPYMREVRSTMDRVISRTPGMSDTLQPRRNVLGEKVKRNTTTGEPLADIFLPIRATNVSDKVIEQEMANLRYGFNPISSSRNGVDLTDPRFIENGQDALDRYSELSGKVKLGGLTLRQAVRKLIKDPRYQALPLEPDDEGNPSPRAALINKVIRRYRKAAWSQLLEERPAIVDEVVAVRSRKAASRRPSLFE